MELQNFNLDLRPKIGNENNFSNYQVVVAHSEAKNAFLILGDFTTIRVKNKKAIIIDDVNFAIKNLNNDIKYVTIDSASFFEEKVTKLPAIKFCLSISDTPSYIKVNIDPINIPHEIKTGGKGVLRFHLDFSGNCDNHPVNVGGWPCLTNKIV